MIDAKSLSHLILAALVDRVSDNRSPAASPSTIRRALENVAANEHIRLVARDLALDGLVEENSRRQFSVTSLGIDKFNQVSAELAIESRTCTEKPKQLRLSEARITEIVGALEQAEGLLSSFKSQEDRAQARSYILAARTLLEAPEPEALLAYDIIERASQVASIASLFVAIIALFAVK